MNDILEDFLSEATDDLAELDRRIVELEKDPNNKELLGEIFRVMHTLKGTSGFMGLNRLGQVAHESETLLDLYRAGAEVTSDGVTIILEAIDTIKELIEAIKANEGKEPEGSDAIIIDLIKDQVSQVSSAVKAAADEPEFDVEDEPAAPTQEEKTPPPAKEPEVTKAEPAPKASPTTATASVKVNVGLLDKLMDLVGELVLVRNQIQQTARSGGEEASLASPVQNLSAIASELQDSVMRTRMQPISQAFNLFPRVVRDLSNQLGKRIDLETEGEHTEIDRQVLELIKDPLTHMVRNCADHAIETPEERRKAGKPEAGKILLKAYHEGGHIIIEVKDDGRGVSVEKVAKKAVESGVVSEERLAKMTSNQIRSLIFNAGLSTAEKVTSVSGRGVGMDVVRMNIEKIGGTISIDSVEGKGTKFIIKIPLTLAIVSAFVIRSGEHYMAIPQINVAEIIDRSYQPSGAKVIDVQGVPMLRMREQFYPVLDLRKVLGEDGDMGNIVVLTQVGAETFGLLVDQVIDIEEIVVKPLSKALEDIRFYSGNTILGDGSVIMIIDPIGLLAELGLGDEFPQVENSDDDNLEVPSDIVQMLVFNAGRGNPKAVHLSVVSRIDTVRGENIHVADDGRLLAQYDDNLMPLVVPENFTFDAAQDFHRVIVFTDEDTSMGLLIENIVEICDTHVDIDVVSEIPGVIGTSIILGKPTEVINVSHYLDVAFKNWFSHKKSMVEEVEDTQILIVDDSHFFRNILSSMLTARGYLVSTAPEPASAIEMMRIKEFDVLISDIEMPVMNGLDFIRHIRAKGPSPKIPAVAISSKASEEDRRAGIDAGFDDYISKTDRDRIFDYLAGVVEQKKEKGGQQ